jgi:putative membrane protein
LLANERTLLSYLRSGVALFIAGISIIHFSNEAWFTGVGFFCLPSGVVTVLFGSMRYRKINRAIMIIRQVLASISPVDE